MAVTAKNLSNQLILVLDTETGTADKPVLKNRAYRQIKPATSDEALYTVGAQLVSLQTMPQVSIRRQAVTELINS